MSDMYKIRRVYFERPGSAKTIKSSLTLEQAQGHCNDPETSSSTCTTAKARAITRLNGEWFDSWAEE